MDLGTAISTLNQSPDSPLGKLIMRVSNEIIKDLQEALVKRDINTSSLGLSQSINPTQIIEEDGKLTIGIQMDYYWKFVNFGVNGTEVNQGAPQWGSVPSSGKTFKEAIKEWIPQRGIQLPPQFKDYDSFAYAIVKNKKKKGQEPRPFYNDVINSKLVGEIERQVVELVGEAIEVSIVAQWQ